jgi:hypothetical protein
VRYILDTKSDINFTDTVATVDVPGKQWPQPLSKTVSRTFPLLPQFFIFCYQHFPVIGNIMEHFMSSAGVVHGVSNFYIEKLCAQPLSTKTGEMLLSVLFIHYVKNILSGISLESPGLLVNRVHIHSGFQREEITPGYFV